MNPYADLLGFGLMIGVGLVTSSVLSLFYDLGRRFTRPWGRTRLQALGLRAGEPKGNRPKDILLGIGGIAWGNLYIGAALLGLASSVLFGADIPAARAAILALPGLVWLARRYLIYQRRRFLAGQVRQFLIDVRLHMSLKGSLLLGLENLARTTLETSPPYTCLRERLRGSSARSGLDLLAQVAGDLASPHMQRTVTHIQAASASGGVLDLDRALAAIIAELNEELTYQSEEHMQRLPLRVTLLAMPFLLAPIVILVFYPLVDRILKTLSGVSVGVGF